MIDEKIIDILQKIKSKCENYIDCGECPFDDFEGCGIVKVIRKLNNELSIEPMYWNINPIRKILRDEQ